MPFFECPWRRKIDPIPCEAHQSVKDLDSSNGCLRLLAATGEGHWHRGRSGTVRSSGAELLQQQIAMNLEMRNMSWLRQGKVAGLVVEYTILKR